MDSRLYERLCEELSSFNITCDERQVNLLLKHLSLVIEKNKVLNLTRITDPLEAVTLHIVDSLLPLACDAVDLSASSSFLDMGTGAGFPGIPLAIVSGSHAILVDSVGKKVAAVSEFCERLGLSNIECLHGRLEELTTQIARTQDYVFARAVAKTNVLIEYSEPYLKYNGLLVVEKGRPEDEEITNASRAADICGFEAVSRETILLPHELGHREILFYKKVRKARIRLPRRVGEAKQYPIGI